MMEKPDEFNRLLAGFLAGASRKPARKLVVNQIAGGGASLGAEPARDSTLP